MFVASASGGHRAINLLTCSSSGGWNENGTEEQWPQNRCLGQRIELDFKIEFGSITSDELSRVIFIWGRPPPPPLAPLFFIIWQRPFVGLELGWGRDFIEHKSLYSLMQFLSAAKMSSITRISSFSHCFAWPPTDKWNQVKCNAHVCCFKKISRFITSIIAFSQIESLANFTIIIINKKWISFRTPRETLFS